MRWVKKHKLSVGIIVTVIVAGGIFIGSVAISGKTDGILGGVTSVYNVIQKPFSAAGNKISSWVDGVLSFRETQAENKRLKTENDELKKKVTELTLADDELQELKRLSKALNYVRSGGEGKVVSGDVISMDGTNWMNVFTINLGTSQGVKVGSAVICGDGLVGRVKECGKEWAKVVALIDESSKISFKISGNRKLIGIANGTADGTLSGFMLDSKAKVVEGDQIITSGMGIYPGGIDIGKITKVQYDSDAQLQRVTIKASVVFKSLQRVSVII